MYDVVSPFALIVQAAAFRSLGHHNLEDAVFLAELVHSEGEAVCALLI